MRSERELFDFKTKTERQHEALAKQLQELREREGQLMRTANMGLPAHGGVLRRSDEGPAKFLKDVHRFDEDAAKVLEAVDRHVSGGPMNTTRGARNKVVVALDALEQATHEVAELHKLLCASRGGGGSPAELEGREGS